MDPLKILIKADENSESSRVSARSAIQKTLRESGLELVARGFTTVEEVFRTTLG